MKTTTRILLIALGVIVEMAIKELLTGSSKKGTSPLTGKSKKQLDKKVDEASMESFPASDAPATY